MGETGSVRFPGNLDPRAEEFRPRHHPYNSSTLTLVHPHIYQPYHSVNELVQVMPFCDSTGGVLYPPYPVPPAHVSLAAENTVSTSLPPPPPTAPSRTLLLSSVAAGVSESAVRRELEVFGDVRAVQMEGLRRRGTVTVHFYDLRHAEAALVAIREQHMQQQSRLRRHFEAVWARNSANFVAPPSPPAARGLIGGCAVWAQFVFPVTTAFPGGLNQGTIVIFNLDPQVSSGHLKEIFESFGPVRELRETPLKRHQRFVEFNDVRDAANALEQMNGKEIEGKPVVIEFSRPGGHTKRLSKSTHNSTFHHFNSNPNYPTGNPHSPPPPPPPLPRQLSGHHRVPPQSKSQPFAMKKWNSNQGSKCASSGDVQESMASLHLVSANGNEGPKKNSKKISYSETKKSSSSRALKGRQAKNYDPRFLINGDAIMEANCGDSRTTVMIKNIPNKYSQKLLLNMLDNHCIHCNERIADGEEEQPMSSYDFVYLPIDFINKCNVGYGFVNMTSPEATWRLYKAFHLQNWEVFNSRKICEVTYARLQGVEALKEHFKNSRFPCEAEEYMPVMFSPPRDGRQHLTDPIPIVGRAMITFNPHHHEMDGSDEPQKQHQQQEDQHNNGHNDDADHHDVAVGGGCSTKGGGDNGGDYE